MTKGTRKIASKNPQEVDETRNPIACTLHRAPVGQGLLPPRPARAFGFWSLRALAKARRGRVYKAGIPGVAGVLGLPAKPIIFWKRAFFFSRVSAIIFFGCFFPSFGGVFCALVFFFFFRASAH